MYLTPITKIRRIIYIEEEIRAQFSEILFRKISKHLWHDTKVFHLTTIFAARLNTGSLLVLKVLSILQNGND